MPLNAKRPFSAPRAGLSLSARSVSALSLAALGLAALGLAAGLLAPSAALAQNAMTDAEREAFRAEVRAFLLEEPQVMLDVLHRLEEYQREQERLAEQEALSILAPDLYEDGYSFVGGNLDGDLTLVEFLDYRCGYCKRAHSHVADFLESDGGVRLIVKEFPVLGPASEYAGRAAMASLMQADGALYKPFHDAMIEHRGDLSRDVVHALARDVGLDLDVLQADMERPEVADNIRRNYEIANALGIRGTPAFIIGGQVIRGFVPAETLLEIASAERAAD